MTYHDEQKQSDVEHIKAKLESAKEELKRRYGEHIQKIKEDMEGEEENADNAWNKLKNRTQHDV